MANPPCMNDDGNAAVFVGTFLAEGDSVALCDSCMVPFAAAMLHAMTGVDPTPFLEAVSDDEVTVEQVETAETADTSPAAAEAPDPTATSEPSGRTSDASPAAGTDADPPVDPMPADGTATPSTA